MRDHWDRRANEWNHWPVDGVNDGSEWPRGIGIVGRQSEENPRCPGWRELMETLDCWWGSRWHPVASSREWNGPQPRQGGEELGFPRPAPGEMQYEAPGLAGDSSGQGEEASQQGLGGCYRLSQSDAPGPAGQIVGHNLYRQPGSIGREAPRGEVIEPNAVLQVPDGVLYLGVAAVVGLQFQGVSLPVGDEGMIAVVGEQRQLGTGGGCA